MRAALFALLAMGACASRAVSPPPSPPTPAPLATPSSGAPASTAAASPAVPALVSLDSLAARSPALAPGMHEVARGEVASDAPPSTRVLVRADASDVCVRVAFVAGPSLHAWLTDARGDVLADVPSTGDGALGARGPVCVRKGDTVTLRLEPAVTATATPIPWTARFVAWASP